MLLRTRFYKLRVPAFSFSTQAKVPTDPKSNDIRNKISNTTFLKYELTQNPEFDKAFPHLAGYKPPTKITRDTSEYDFITSLSYHKRVPEERPVEETIQENNKRFAEGYKTRKGPIQWMAQEDKDKVHDQVETKMEELEETGLSREELMYDGKTGGVPLALDPFFQFLKSNRLAREILFKPGESFTVEKVIEMSLRQDIGLDPVHSRRKRNYLLDHQIDEDTRYQLARNQLADREAFDPNAYYAEHHNKLNMTKEVLADPHRKYFKMPKTREQAKRENFRVIDPLDVHWRNTEFLTKFVGDAGKIKNRFQNRLSRMQQKLVSQTIKHSRDLLLLPHHGYLKPTDKKSLRTLQDDIQDFLKKKINIETGQIYFDAPGENLESENPYEVQNPSAFDKEGFEAIKDLEFEFMPIMPDTDEVKILEAQHYANRLKQEELKKRGINVEELKKNRAPELDQPFLFRPVDMGEEKEIPEQDLSRFAQSFEQFKDKVKSIPVEKFIEAYIVEKAVSGKHLNKLKEFKPSGGENKSKEDLLNDIDQIKRELGVV